jgi:hypothetical protein
MWLERRIEMVAGPYRGGTLNRADWLANLALFVFAITAWAGVAFLFSSSSPQDGATPLLSGALLLGAAVMLTVAPVLWLFGFVRHKRIAYRGDWWRAFRRGALAGLVVVLYVFMRGQGLYSLPLMLFIVAMAVLVEVTLTLRG